MNSVTIWVPNDEGQARVELIAWLAHPKNQRLRARAANALRDLARYAVGQKAALRSDRLDSALRRTDYCMRLNLLVGEVFRRQLLTRRLAGRGPPSPFDITSTKAMARMMAVHGFRSDEREARRLFAQASSILHLAVGASDGLAEHPGILTRPSRAVAGQVGKKVPGLLLNDSRQWALRTIRLAQELKLDAIKLGHPQAHKLADVSVFPLPL